MEAVNLDGEDFLSDPAVTDDMLPHKVVSSHGHQMLTLHESTSSDSVHDFDTQHVTEDTTSDLPNLSPLWQENSVVWSDDYRPDLASPQLDNSLQLAAVRDVVDWQFDPDLF